MATNFFDQQDAARRRTGLLIVYFVLAVVAIIAAVYLAVTAIFVTTGNQGHVFDPERLVLVAAIVGVVIVAGTLYKIAVLQEGGSAVARMLGGRLVDPSSSVLEERRLLNVVEEMAVASGTPVPPVYVLDSETGINAFAAGFSPRDAVIAVSRGGLDLLTRDELQGVIAHEFSHLLNGDMRLNLRVIGLLHGILLLAVIGEILIRWQGNSGVQVRAGDDRESKDNSGVAFFLLGLALLVIGSAGVFFGRLIKSAISRQREFLADASAVQFTRNPDGIAGALKKIGGLAEGSRIENPHAEEACHLFFSMGVPALTNLLATHPPLVERIRRIDPSFDGTFPAVEAPVPAAALVEPAGARRRGGEARVGALPLAPTGRLFDSSMAVAATGVPKRPHVDRAVGLVASLPPLLLEAVREPFTARAVVFSLLLDQDPASRRNQLAHLETESEPGTMAEIRRLEPLISPLGDAVRLPLAELALPALRKLSSRQYQRFRDQIEFLIASDQRLTLFEFALERMLKRHLDRQYGARPPAHDRYARLGPVGDHLVLLLSALAHAGHADDASARRAFADGLARFGMAPRGRALLPAGACPLLALDPALDRLAASAPQVKSRILDAAAAAISSDGRVTLAEGEMLRAIADSLDCPMPPLLAPAAPVADAGRDLSAGAASPLLPS